MTRAPEVTPKCLSRSLVKKKDSSKVALMSPKRGKKRRKIGVEGDVEGEGVEGVIEVGDAFT